MAWPRGAWGWARRAVSAGCGVGSVVPEKAGLMVGMRVGVWVVDARPGGAGYGVAVEEGHFD